MKKDRSVTVEYVTLLGVRIRINANDDFLSMTDLVSAINKDPDLNKDRVVFSGNSFETISFQEKVFLALQDVVISGEKAILSNQIFVDSVIENGFISTLKARNLYYTTGRDESKSIWVHKVIWVLFAMEHSPKLFALALIEGFNPASGFSMPLSKINVSYLPMVTYVMIDDHTGLFKIGRSRNPKQRESTLFSEKPSVRLILTLPVNKEKELHSLFSDKRVRGEWFSLDEKDISEISNYCTEAI